MNNDSINDPLRKRIVSENIQVSKLVNNRIDETLASLPSRKAMRIPLSKIATLAISISVLAIFTCTVFPTYASELPIIGSVFRYFKSINNNQVISQYINYSKAVNQSVDVNGVKITIDEVTCDINSLVVSYTIQSKSELNARKDDIFQYAIVNNKHIGRTTTANDKNVDTATIMGITKLDISSDNLPDDFILNFGFDRVGSIQGNWDFKFSVSTKEINKLTKVYKPNISARLDLWNYTVNKITMTPFSSRIFISGTELKALEKMPYNFFVFDNNNILIANYDGTDSSYSVNSENKFEMSFSFIKSKNSIDSITLIPYTCDYSAVPDGLAMSNNINNLPSTIEIGNKGIITINSVTLNESSTSVDYSINGYSIYSILYLVDETGNRILPLQTSTRLLADPSKGEYLIEFPKIDETKTYKVGAVKNPTIKLLEQNKLTIPLK